MTKKQDNKAIVGRWFEGFWGDTYNPEIVDELAAPDMLLQYSLHAPRRGRADIKAFMNDFRAAFPDLAFVGVAELIAEGDYVVGRWEGGGTHTGPAFDDFLIGSLPAASGRKMHFTGTTVLRVKDGKIVEEIGLDDGVTALQQLGILRAAQTELKGPKAADAVLERLLTAEQTYSEDPSEKNWQAVADSLDPEFVLYQADSLPFAGVWRGPDGFRSWMKAMAEHFTTFGGRDAKLIADGETVIVAVTLEGELRKTGKHFEMPIVQVNKVRAGRVLEVRPFYWDTAATSAALGHGQK